MSRRGIAIVFVLALGPLIWWLRSVAMSTDTQPAPESRMAVVVEVDKKSEPAFSHQDLAEILLLECRTIVDAELLRDRTEQLQDDVFSYVLAPDLNDSDRQELRGCLQDWRLDHAVLRVLEMETLQPDGDA